MILAKPLKTKTWSLKQKNTNLFLFLLFVSFRVVFGAKSSKFCIISKKRGAPSTSATPFFRYNSLPYTSKYECKEKKKRLFWYIFVIKLLKYLLEQVLGKQNKKRIYLFFQKFFVYSVVSWKLFKFPRFFSSCSFLVAFGALFE